MLSKKLLIGVGDNTLAAKTAICGVNTLLSPLALLFSTPWPSHQAQAVISELFHLKDNSPTGVGARAGLHKRSVPRKALSDELAANDIAQKVMAAHHRPHMVVAWTAAQRILLIFPLTASLRRRARK
jgi:hypothetical protein